MVVDGNDAPLVGLQADRFEIELVGIRYATDRDDHPVALKFPAGALGIVIAHRNAVCGFGDLVDPDAEFDVQSLLSCATF